MGTSGLLAARTSVDVGEGLKEILNLANATDVISFAGGFPDPATFPGATLVELLDHIVGTGDASAMQYSPTPGIDSVRDYLRTRLETLEGVRPGDGELMVTSGAVEAVELVCKRFLDPHDVVAVEAPTYLGAIMAFRGHEADITTVDTDEDGLRVDVLEDHLRRGQRPKLLYTIPDYQNPRGVSLSEERRDALVELADRYGFLIVEDVAYRELHFDGPPPPSLWARAPSLVVQVGTFSKTFFPGVRLGWAAGARDVVDQMVIAKQNTDQCAGALGQRLLEEYGRRGLLDERLVASRQLYRGRRDRLVAALERSMPDSIRWAVPHGGFFVWLEAGGDIDSVELARRARARGVTFVPGVPFYPDGRGRRNIRLAYSRVDGADLDQGCRRLAGLLVGEPPADGE
jgi:2-aminoadipate transaminase